MSGATPAFPPIGMYADIPHETITLVQTMMPILKVFTNMKASCCLVNSAYQSGIYIFDLLL